MKYSLVLIALLSVASFAADKKKDATQVNIVCPTSNCVKQAEITNPVAKVKKRFASKKGDVLDVRHNLLINVIGQGVAPANTSSPAQAYALAKRAAVADAYRLIAEKVKGVRIDGQDLVKNMMVKRSTIRTSVQAMVRNANIIETTFKDGLCEVEMEIALSRNQFPQ